MIEITIKNAYAEAFRYFGEIQLLVDKALKHYAIEKVNEKIAELGSKVRIWENRYGCSYDVFKYRTATDEDYVDELNKNQTTAIWEGDIIVWEYQASELAKWYQCLQNILIE